MSDNHTKEIRSKNAMIQLQLRLIIIMPVSLT